MIDLKKIKYHLLGSFRYKKLGNKYLLTNEWGDWVFLSAVNFQRFLYGEIGKDSALYKELEEKNFVKNGLVSHSEGAKRPKNLGDSSPSAQNDNRGMAQNNSLLRLHQKCGDMTSSLWQGPSLHIMVLTLRCNHRCIYCQAIPENVAQKEYDMSLYVAKKTVDFIFRSPSPAITIEFQGGEPLLNWPILKHTVLYANALNKTKNKNLKISLVSNLAAMDDAKLNFLLKNRVNICTSFDGPEKVHNKNRVYLGGNSYKTVVEKIKKINAALKKMDAKKRIDFHALMTTTKFSLPFYKEIIDEYVKLGFNGIFLRPLSYLGLSYEAKKRIGYNAEEFIKFYKKSLDYILKLNKKGKFFSERNATMIFKKILEGKDANYAELRSPCGAVSGQIAYNYDGKIFTCDEGRMAYRMGHNDFYLGDIQDNDYRGVVDNPTLKTLILGSCLDNIADCDACVYKPYCGTCPILNYINYKTLFPVMSRTDKCKINKAIFNYLFEKIGQGKYKAIFEQWLKQ